MPLKPGEIKQMQTLVDESLQHRLVLEYVAVAVPQLENGGFGFDFHALHLQSLRNSRWQNDLTITYVDFLKESDNRRWVAKIHSFDHKNQTAILQIGTEGSSPQSTAVEYYWCEWSLARNCLVRRIKVCENPFDTFDG